MARGQQLVEGVTLDNILQPMPLPPEPPLEYEPEDRNWCTVCRVHEAHVSLCPCCLDDGRRKALVAASQQASNCRGER